MIGIHIGDLTFDHYNLRNKGQMAYKLSMK
jgi:hypothetical protein